MIAIPGRRRVFQIFNRTFSLPSNRLKRSFCILASAIMDKCFYFLGIILIFFATGIASFLVYSFFYILLPMINRAHAEDYLSYFWPLLHILYVVFLLTNVIFNYLSCIMTNHNGPLYKRIVRELANATNFDYPETLQDINECKRDFEDLIVIRLQRRRARAEEQMHQAQENQSQKEQIPLICLDETTGTIQRKLGDASNNAAASQTNLNNNTKSGGKISPETGMPVRKWMILGPHEWAFCDYSHQPKPPRSHYDHVTKNLVLNMDHYCPWMFNCVGFLNYRYFYNFLVFVFISMIYGVSLSFKPFLFIQGKLYHEQIRSFQEDGFTSAQHIYPYVPIPEERSAVSFTLVLCASIGIAVTTLLLFHTYLLLTAQTTIEFHSNCANKRRARQRKKKFRNPYDLGWKRNFQQIYGTGNAFFSLILPSTREPEFLPLPLPSREGLRRKDLDYREVLHSRGPMII